MSKKANAIHWVLGIFLCSFGICLCTKAGFGLSMIAAPPYIIHTFLQKYFSWYTQGKSEYIWEAVIILITCIAVRKFKPKYLLSFLTAIISGSVIDGGFLILGDNSVYARMPSRIIAFIIGSSIISLAVAFFFRTTYPLQAYELIVTEIADRYSFDKSKVKWANDGAMLVITLVLAGFLTKSWAGLGVGTVIVTIVNAPLIKFFGKIIDKVEKK